MSSVGWATQKGLRVGGVSRRDPEGKADLGNLPDRKASCWQVSLSQQDSGWVYRGLSFPLSEVTGSEGKSGRGGGDKERGPGLLGAQGGVGVCSGERSLVDSNSSSANEPASCV